MKKYLIIVGTIGLITGFLIAFAIYQPPQTELLSPFVARAEAYQEPVRVSVVTGKASYYNRGICKLHGTVYGKNCETKNGDLFDDRAMAAACPWKLLNQYITVTHKNKSITVRCTDTGSFGEKYKRVLDLSQGAFEQLAPASKGIIDVSYQVNEKYE